MALLKNHSNISHFPLFFIVLRCQMLFPPLNGFVEGECDNTYGSTCKMMCNDGYNLLGSDILTCLKKPGHITGYWDNPVPVCKSKCQIGLLAIVSRCQYTYPFRFVFISRKKKIIQVSQLYRADGPWSTKVHGCWLSTTWWNGGKYRWLSRRIWASSKLMMVDDSRR